MQSLLKCFVISLLTITPLASAQAADAAPYTITFKGGSFEPKELTIPANTKVKLEIDNQESKTIEFESHDMKAEKIIKSGKKRPVFVGPLKAGEYSFFDEFNEAAGKGKVIVK
jgi:plastocyanin